MAPIKSNSTRYVRLIAAVVGACTSCLFVALYSWASETLMRHESNEGSLPLAALILAGYSNYAFVIPGLMLILGLWSGRRGEREIMHELSIGGSWTFAVFWFGCALLVWRFAQIPVFHPHE